MTLPKRPTSVNASLNELSAALKRAFEGLGCAERDYQDAAQMVLWLEAHGLRGLEMAQRVWPRLAGNTGSSLRITAAQPALSVMHAGNGSVLFTGPSAVDLAYANARQTGISRVEMRDCTDRAFVAGCLAGCASRGSAALAHWQDAGGKRLIRIAANASCPQYRRYSAAGATADAAQTLVIACGDAEKLDRYLAADFDTSACVETIAPDTLRQKYEDAEENGVTVDTALWRWLSEASSTVLVEATARSRRGAGEQE